MMFWTAGICTLLNVMLGFVSMAAGDMATLRLNVFSALMCAVAMVCYYFDGKKVP